MNIEPIILSGTQIRLEPLSFDHLDGLCEVGLEPELWRWIPTAITNRDEMRAYVETALRSQAEGKAIPFATVLNETDQVVGSTRFANIDRENKHVEIGWTWIGKPWQRTAVNTEAKYLMLQHAFETLGCIRVEFKTDSLNQQSRNAILRIGAREEGTFRNHMITQSGRYRHSVYFSVIDSEWPDVKTVLEARLAGRS
ncbi:MAG TPA: GNAT family protein [Pyrinomonadaceae bacterium]|jgi:RimJ/RimL family protein N-acetyltransferase|nr:GNAT family protein [Pyrinomonadaceae bacterium]